MRHPRTIEEITAPWMTEVLREAGVIGPRACTGVDIHVIGEGVGFLSNRARVALTYDGPAAGAPATVVVKMPGITKASADFEGSTHVYEREIRFYKEVAPKTSIRVPRVYAEVMDEREHVFILVLEDLKALAAGDQIAGLTRAQALACARTIAGLHAAWWNGDQRGALPWIPSVDRQMRDLDITPAHFRAAWPVFLEEYASALPRGGRALGDRVAAHLDGVVATFYAAPRTLAHFDYRADNLFFDDPARPDSVVVLDWQLATWGPGAYDLARLVGGSLPPSERGGHHEELVECWHAALVSGGVVNYSLADAWRDYRVGAIMATLNPVLYSYILKTGGARGNALASAMVTRFFTDLVECGAEAVIA